MIHRVTELLAPQFSLTMVRLGSAALRFVVLSLALLAYGMAPASAAQQTEYESQVQEDLALGNSNQLDLRARLRGATLRRGKPAIISFGQLQSGGARDESASESLGSRLSASQTLRLRC